MISDLHLSNVLILFSIRIYLFKKKKKDLELLKTALNLFTLKMSKSFYCDANIKIVRKHIENHLLRTYM